MKIKLYDILVAFESNVNGSQELSVMQKLVQHKFEITTSYAIHKTFDLLMPYYKRICDERTKLITQYGEKDGDFIKVKQENRDIVTKQLDEFLAMEEEVDIQPININKLTDFQINANEINRLKFILTEI